MSRLRYAFDSHFERDYLIGKAYATLASLYNTSGGNEQNTAERNRHVGRLIEKFGHDDNDLAKVVVDMIGHVAAKNLETGIAFANFVSSETEKVMDKHGEGVGLGGPPIAWPLIQLRDGAGACWKELVIESGKRYGGVEHMHEFLTSTILSGETSERIRQSALNMLNDIRQLSSKSAPPKPA